MSTRPISAEDLLSIVYVGDPQISPDGNRILFSRKVIAENKYQTHLWTVDREGVTQSWTSGLESVSHGRWSPDGHAIAFLANRAKKGLQIHLLPTTGGEARAVTSLAEGAIGRFLWSPNGKYFALTYRQNLPGTTDADKKAREVGNFSEPPLEIDNIWYRLDGDGYFGNQRFQLLVIDANNGTEVMRYSGDVQGNYEFDWSPDSTKLAVIHSASARPFSNPHDERVYLLDLQAKVTELSGQPQGHKSTPKWSPDGKWIAYSGNHDPHDSWGSSNSRLYVAPSAGGEPKELTAGTDFDLGVATLSDTQDAGFGANIFWHPNSQGIYAQIGWNGSMQLGWAPLGGQFNLLTEGNHTIALGSVSHDGQSLAVTFGHPTAPAEIALLQPELVTGRWTPKLLTSFNQALLSGLDLAVPTERLFPSTDNTKVHGWVFTPPNADDHSALPAVLQVHGGPHAQYGWAFFHEMQLLAAKGFVVVLSNPRGSKGYGEGHCMAIRGAWGGKDWEDVHAVTEWMKGQSFIDPKRIGIMGGSYGGYMTNWAIGHSKDYAVAITDRCVSNMVSMSGNSDFPFNQDKYFRGVAWGTLEEIRELWQQSPIAYFEGVTTPTLVIHSEGDLRCNVEQGEQIFTALQMQNVPSRFVRYPRSTFHGMSRSGPPDLRLHRLNEMLQWLGRWIGTTS